MAQAQSLQSIAYSYKMAHPEASLADFIAFIIENKQNCLAGKQMARGFWRALDEMGIEADGDYRFC